MKREELLQTAKQILFNAEMTKAILDGRKVQTRRALTGRHYKLVEAGINLGECNSLEENHPNDKDYFIDILSKYKTGDILWVREPARINNEYDGNLDFTYLADNMEITIPMPYRLYKDVGNGFLDLPEWIFKNRGVPNGCIKEMARIFLKVTNVRVERLCDISDDDCQKEGARPSVDGNAKDWKYNENGWHRTFRQIWDKTAQEGYKWEDSPYVFVYEFERMGV